MRKTDKIYVAGHRGMVGSAVVRALNAAGYDDLVTRTHRELDLLDLDGMLVLSRLFLALVLLKAILAVVHDLAHGRICIGGNFHQIQPLIPGDAQGFGSFHDSELTFGADYTNLGSTDRFVDECFVCGCYGRHLQIKFKKEYRKEVFRHLYGIRGQGMTPKRTEFLCQNGVLSTMPTVCRKVKGFSIEKHFASFC